MMRGRTLILTALVCATTTVGFFGLTSHAFRSSTDRSAIGPDVVAFTIAGNNSFDMDYYGTSNGIGGYSIATQSCNYGDEEADWWGGTNDSPIIMQNIFRLKNDRFEQIGMQAFMKHSFCALSESGCGNCQATNCNTLGVGCADTYWAGLNSSGNAPRSDINAHTGYYPYPFTHSPSGPSSIKGNLQIANVDVDPAQNAGARYFVEAYYVSTDDAPAGNQDNNASWREITFSSISNPQSLGNGPSATNVGDPAIRAWAGIDPSVVLTEKHAPDDGLILIGVKVFDNGNGTWDYDYAIHNMNCDRSINVVEIPTGSAIITNVGFKDIDYNSGEIYDNADWSSSVNTGSVSWNGATYAQNPNGNALRWGTMYNFRFTATAAPESGSIELGLFKPGGADSYAMATIIPAGDPVDPCDLPLGNCPEDIDGNGFVGVGDLLAVIKQWGDCGDGTYRPAADVNGDCCVDVSDILQVIAAWGQDCGPVGACCLGDGGCSELSESSCLKDGGDYQGDKSLCDNANCPAPGACCLEDGSCVNVMQNECTELSGVFQGEWSTCDTVDCPIPGDGDECKSAMFAVVGANAFETNSATSSGNPPDDSQCAGTYLDWNDSPDVWFLFVPTSSGNVHFTTCDASSYDTSMALYEGACDNQVACNGDDEGDSGCQAYYSAFDYNVQAGESYYIRLGGWQGITGVGTLTIE